MRISLHMLWILFALLFTIDGMALDVSSGLFGNVPMSDKSRELLGFIFGGNVGSIPLGSGDQIDAISELFLLFNQIMISAGTLIVSYIYFVGTINTTQEGEVMGKKYASLWIPLRSASGMLLLVPSSSGYSLIQVLIMWCILTGVGAANTLWNNVFVDKSGYVKAKLYSEEHKLQSAKEKYKQLISDEKIIPIWKMIYKKNLIEQHYNLMLEQDRIDLPVDSKIFSENNIRKLLGSYVFNTVLDPDLAKILIAPKTGRANLNVLGGIVIKKGTLSDSSFKTVVSAYNILFSALDLAAEEHIKLSSNWSSSSDLTKKEIEKTIKRSVINSLNSFYAELSKLATLKQANTDDLLKDSSYGWLAAGSYYEKFIKDNGRSFNWENPANIDVSYEKADMELSNNFEQTTETKISIIAMTNFSELLTETNNADYSIDDDQILNNFSEFNMFENETTESSKVDQWLHNHPKLDPRLKEKLSNLYKSTDIATDFSIEYNSLSNDVRARGDHYIKKVLLKSFIEQYKNTEGLEDLNTMILNYKTLPIFVEESFKKFLEPHKHDPISSIKEIGKKLIIDLKVENLYGNTFKTKPSIPQGQDPGPANQFKYEHLGLMMFLWTTGAMMYYYIPMIPYLVYVATIAGWFVLCVEAIVSAPILALGLIMPSQDELGKITPGLSILANLVIRPVLIIVGFVFSIRVVKVLLMLLALSISEPISDLISESQGVGLQISTLMPLLIYSMLAMVIINKSFALTYLIPDKVLRWIGVSPENSIVGDLYKEAEQGVQKQKGELSQRAQQYTGASRQLEAFRGGGTAT